MKIHDDKKVLDSFLGGDREAFGMIVEKYNVQVYRLAYKFTQNRKDAEDVAQDTFLRAYENLVKHPKEELNLKPWLMTICVNLCRNLAKKKKNFNFSAFDNEDDDRQFVDSVKEKGPGVMEKLKKKEEKEVVQLAVGRLPDKYQVVIHMRYKEDLNYTEIADVLGLPMNTVKVHLNRAKKQLKKYLTGHLGPN